MHVGVDEAVAELRAGRTVVLTADREGESEGHLVLAAVHATPAALSFMLVHGRGVVCLALTAARADRLGLRSLGSRGHDLYGSSVTPSIEARGIRDGVSAAGRARTISVAIDPSAGPGDLSRPGHVFPLRAEPGGVLRRAGRTEAGTDLAHLAGLHPAAVVCEILDDEGGLTRGEALAAYCARHGLKAVAIADLVDHRWRSDRLVTRDVEIALPTAFGPFRALAYRDTIGGETHVAMLRGEPTGADDVLVGVHLECLVGDVFGSGRCACQAELRAALRLLADAQVGVLVYLTKKGRGRGLLEALDAIEPEPAEVRFGAQPRIPAQGVAGQILRDLGVRSARLLTDDDAPFTGLERDGLRIVERVPLGVGGAHDHQRVWP